MNLTFKIFFNQCDFGRRISAPRPCVYFDVLFAILVKTVARKGIICVFFSHIILMLADDMACNPRNPRPGKLNVFPRQIRSWTIFWR